MNDDRDYRIAAVDRSLRVMEALAERPDQGVTDIAQRLGLTKSIVFRILATLQARGFAYRDPDRAVWSLGYRLSVLGERSGPSRGLLQAARPIMEALRDTTNENVNLIVRDGHQSLVVATYEGRHRMRLFAQAGRHGPLHAGGGSLLLLAYAPTDIQDAVMEAGLERFTDRTITDPAALRQTLDRIRRNGWNIAQSDLDDGAFSIASPIRGVNGEVIAALSVAGAQTRFDEDRRDLYLTAVQDAAHRISRRLGLAPEDAVDSRAA